MFNVSEKQWTKVGLPASAYMKIKQLGYAIVWKQGGGFTLQDKDGCQWGFAKVKNDTVFPDHIFKVKYQELVGQPLTILKVVDPADGAVVSGIIEEALKDKAKPVGTKTASELPKAKVEQVLHGKNLSNVDDVGVYVKGTDSPYLVYMLSDDCNIAYRYKSGQLAIRTENMSKEATAALTEWGLGPKVMPDGRKYASVHLQAPSLEIVRRTLGSVAASVLTKPPLKLLSKDKVV